MSSLGPKKGHDVRGRKDSLIIRVGGFSDEEWKTEEERELDTALEVGNYAEW